MSISMSNHRKTFLGQMTNLQSGTYGISQYFSGSTTLSGLVNFLIKQVLRAINLQLRVI